MLSIDTLLDRDKLDMMVDSFEAFASVQPALHGVEITPLPKGMRLLDYFIVNSDPNATQYFTSGKVNYYDGQDTDKAKGAEDKVAFHIGATYLRHEKLFLFKTEPLYREVLSIENGEEQPTAFLYSSNIEHGAGNDYLQINKVGSVVYMGEEIATNFISKNRLKYDTSKYKVSKSREEISVTPKFDVTEDNFTQTMNDIIGITNQVLKKLETKLQKQVNYFKPVEIK